MKILSISLLLGAAALAVLAVPAALGAPVRGSAAARTSIAVPPPTAAEFARTVADSTNLYAKRAGGRAKLTNVNCVEASTGRYMCSYALTWEGLPRECHLMQATWTAGDGSLYAVTLAGRVRTCGTLEEALRSLR